MKVQMVYGLARVRASISHHPIAAFGQALLAGYLGSDQSQLTQQLGVFIASGV